MCGGWDSNPRTPKGRDHPFSEILSPACPITKDKPIWPGSTTPASI
jgi:hypothetical protein